MKPIFHDGFKPIASCYQQIKSTAWGYGPSGGIGLILIILLVLMLLGKF